MTLIAYAFAAAAVILAGLHLDLRSRHRRCKATLARVAAERDAAKNGFAIDPRRYRG